MPTYRNDTDKRITHYDRAYMEWQPGQTRRVPFFVPYKELGLTKVSDDPLAKTFVQQWTIEFQAQDAGTFDIPYMERFELSIVGVSGTVRVYVANDDTGFTVDAGQNHVSTYDYTHCPYLRFVTESAAKILVKVEEKTWKDMQRRSDY
jgi:hypothetical protein